MTMNQYIPVKFIKDRREDAMSDNVRKACQEAAREWYPDADRRFSRSVLAHTIEKHLAPVVSAIRAIPTDNAPEKEKA